jgi:hypothetical protein
MYLLLNAAEWDSVFSFVHKGLHLTAYGSPYLSIKVNFLSYKLTAAKKTGSRSDSLIPEAS